MGSYISLAKMGWVLSRRISTFGLIAKELNFNNVMMS